MKAQNAPDESNLSEPTDVQSTESEDRTNEWNVQVLLHVIL